MRLKELIERLIEIQNSKENYNPEVLIMQEYTIFDSMAVDRDIQISSEAKDIATVRDELIIIGNEID